MGSQLPGIVTLLRSALNDEALTRSEDFDWSSAANILYEQHLVGIAVRGAVPRSHPAIRHYAQKDGDCQRNMPLTLKKYGV